MDLRAGAAHQPVRALAHDARDIHGRHQEEQECRSNVAGRRRTRMTLKGPIGRGGLQDPMPIVNMVKMKPGEAPTAPIADAAACIASVITC